MIDRLQRMAQAIQILRLPTVAIGLFCSASIVVIIIVSESHAGDRYIIPGFVGLLWALSTYAFIVIFRSVPEKAGKSLGFFSRLKRRTNRGWYWFIGVLFLGTTLAALFVTYRLVSIWLQDYGG